MGLKLKNKVILAGLSGITDGKFCRKIAETGAGAVILEEISFDKEILEAYVLMVKRGRKKFVIELNKLKEFIKNEVKVIKGLTAVIINARFATKEGLIRTLKISNLFLKNGTNYISIRKLALEELNKLKLIIENFKVHYLTF